MASKQCSYYYIVLVLEILVFFGVIGNSRLVSKDEELPPHKHAVKTIKTQHGDIYDCVDFYKQPSLDHPLLKNHNFHPEMRPTSIPKGQDGREISQNEKDSFLDRIRLKDGGCTKGTVPIRRMSKHGVLPPITSLPYLHATNSSTQISNYNRPGTFYAIAQTKNDVTKGHYGVGAYITTYQPHIYKSFEYSSAQVIIKSGSDSIVVGWTVNPSVYKDNSTRFFVYTIVNDKPCFNGECGFISVRQDIPPDFLIKQLSTRGDQTWLVKVLVHRDPINENWWLEVQDVVIGFWSSRLFIGLAKSGSYLACGGEVYFPNEKSGGIPPDMGCGFKPNKKALVDNSFCDNFNRVNEKNQLVDVDNSEEYANDPDNYRVWDKGYTGNQYGHVVLFGGPNK